MRKYKFTFAQPISMLLSVIGFGLVWAGAGFLVALGVFLILTEIELG